MHTVCTYVSLYAFETPFSSVEHDDRDWANYVQFVSLLDWQNNPVQVEKTDVRIRCIVVTGCVWCTGLQCSCVFYRAVVYLCVFYRAVVYLCVFYRAVVFVCVLQGCSVLVCVLQSCSVFVCVLQGCSVCVCFTGL